MKKILWIDLETTGIDKNQNGICQIAALIEIDNKIVDQFESKMRTRKRVDLKALEVTGFTFDQVTKSFPDPTIVFNQFVSFLSKYGRAGDKQNRFIMAGYNAPFDLDFLSQWFQEMTGGPYTYWDYLQFSPIDPLPICRAMRYAGIIDTVDTKLESICKHFEIPIDAHDAMSDIKATRELCHKIFEKMFSSYTGKNHGLLGPIN